jgi:hypothetical protein
MKKLFIFGLVWLFPLMSVFASIDTDNVLFFYDFNGDANDLFGNYNGVVTDANLVSGVDGNPNSAYEFLNSTSVIDTTFATSDTPTSDISISFMFRMDSIGGENYFVHDGIGVGTRTTYVRVQSSNLFRNFFFNSAGSAIHGTTDYQTTFTDTSNWHHAVFQYDASTKRVEFWLDNVSIGSAIEGIKGQSANSVYLGNSGVGTRQLNGRMDNVLFYNQSLTSTQISDLFAVDNDVSVFIPIDETNATVYAQDNVLLSTIRNITVVNTDTNTTRYSNLSSGEVLTDMFTDGTPYNFTISSPYYITQSYSNYVFTQNVTQFILQRNMSLFVSHNMTLSNQSVANFTISILFPDTINITFIDDPFTPFDYETYFAGEGVCPLNEGQTDRTFFIFIIGLLLALFIFAFYLDNSLIGLLSSIGFLYSGWLLTACDLYVGGITILISMIGIYLSVSQLSITGQSE